MMPGYRANIYNINRWGLFLYGCLSAAQLQAQLITVNPAYPQENTSITIVMDARKGNQALLNYSAVNDVYVHVGVITNLSSGASGWRYVKFTWGSTDAAARASSLGNNQYQYTISNIRSFFGVPSTETIQKIALLFRNGSGSLAQRNSDGSDLYIPVYGSTLAGRFLLPPLEPRYVPVPEPVTAVAGQKVAISWGCNLTAAISLSLNGALVKQQSGVTQLSDSLLISAPGNQLVEVAASAGGITLTDRVSFFVAPPVNQAQLPAGVRDGINYDLGDTSVVFVLYAPGKTRVSLIGDFNNWTETVADQMSQTPDGNRFWLRRSLPTPGTEYGYQFIVDGTLKIADPYAEKVLDPGNDPFINAQTYPNLKAYPNGKTTGIVGVVQTAKPAFTWQYTNFVRPDKRSLVIYEVLLRDFIDNRDWQTLQDTLPYLKALGINAIELMPFNEFEGNNSWGYNPSFYFAPDKYYGTETRLKQFIDACHRLGIAVIMDIALNHSFGQSPMVQLYFDAAQNRPSAQNPWFNPVARHAFNVGYDMNHDSEATRYWVSRVLEHWLQQYRIDGFRFDLSKGFTQVPTCDANGDNCNVQAWGAYDVSRIALWKRYYDTVQKKSPGAYAILEHFADNTEEKELADYGMLLWGNMNYSFNEATMGYVNNSNFEGALHTARGWSQPHLIAYMESHDEERLLFKNLNFGAASGFYNIRDLNIALRRNELAAAFLFMMPGPKMIWQFGELGYDYSINYCTNGTVNPGCRLDPKPARWDYLQQSNRKRLHDVYRALLSLRAHPLYSAGFLTNRVERSLSGAFKWLKLTTDTSNLVVVGNVDLKDATGTVTFPNTGTWYDYLTGATFPVTAINQTLTLKPGEYHVYVNRNVTYPVYSVTPVRELPLQEGLLRLRAYPNPFTTAGMLEYELPAAGRVTLTVINSTGQRVACLQEGFRSKGVHRIARPSLMPAGSWPRGLYFLHLELGRFRLTERLVIEE